MSKQQIILGSRGSILALAQTNWVKEQLEKYHPELSFSIQIIETQGDKDLHSHFGNSQSSLKSFFTKEIEKSLLEGEIDIAVHSMKDVPSVSPAGLICGAIPIREDVRDVLISRSGKPLAELPQGAIIGTSSLRRIQNIKKIRPDLEIKALRGNIHTRLRKLEEEQYDAIILAAAGLKRVKLEEKITEYLDPTVFPPAPAQGALYIQCREEDIEVQKILQSIHNKNLEKVLVVEREFSKIFDGGCHTPMGCYSNLQGDTLEFFAMYSHENKRYQTKVVENLSKGKDIARMAAQKIEKMFK
ncbi:hydroxymethylbilane synthase [Fusobacterium gonidiaformans 3-1-5R]|uniref:Porphobilinogen deaminase n=2 Tax=Fusobacterium TaxID=848 RepID=E5BEF0_9FUSO|nr:MULTISPECIES: hydroxymethylbilane synthase [Fusobacterium]EFS21426.1 hydroxymethylbilane synthase [Fusobacterium gonidiaformans 3-1-5R]KXA12522.1 hydroxymethylbilane synthase [Fusobacterium equinum]